MNKHHIKHLLSDFVRKDTWHDIKCIVDVPIIEDCTYKLQTSQNAINFIMHDIKSADDSLFFEAVLKTLKSSS